MKIIIECQDWALYQPETVSEVIGFWNEDALEPLKTEPLGVLLWNKNHRSLILSPCAHTHYRFLGCSSYEGPSFFRSFNDALKYILAKTPFNSPPEAPPVEMVNRFMEFLHHPRNDEIPEDSCMIWRYHLNLLIAASEKRLSKNVPRLASQLYDLSQLIDHICLSDKILLPFSSPEEKIEIRNLATSVFGNSDDIILWDAGESKSEWYSEIPYWHNYFEGYLRYHGVQNIPHESWQPDCLSLQYYYENLSRPLYARTCSNSLSIPVPYDLLGVFCNAVRPGESEALFSLIRLYAKIGSKQEKERRVRFTLGGPTYVPLKPISNVAFSRAAKPPALITIVEDLRNELDKPRQMLREFRMVCRDENSSHRDWLAHLRKIQHQFGQLEEASSVLKFGNGTDATDLISSEVLDEIEGVGKEAWSDEGLNIDAFGKGVASFLLGKSSKWLLGRWKNRHIAPLLTIMREDAMIKSQLQHISNLFDLDLTQNFMEVYYQILKDSEFMHSMAYQKRRHWYSPGPTNIPQA